MSDKTDSLIPISVPSHPSQLLSADFKLVKRKIQTMLLLRFNTLGCLVNSLEPEYFTYFGEELNYRKLGFPSLSEMLENMQMEVSLSEVSARNSKVVHAQPMDHQTTFKYLKQLFSRDLNQNPSAKLIGPNDQPLRKKPRNGPHFIFNPKANALKNGLEQNGSHQNQNPRVAKNSESREKEGASSSKLTDKILVKIEGDSPTNSTQQQQHLSSNESNESTKPPRKSGRERHVVPVFDASSNSNNSNSSSTPSKSKPVVKKGEQKKLEEPLESKSLSQLLELIEKELEAKKCGSNLEQAWLSIFDMTIEEPDLDVLLKVTQLFIQCLDTFPNKQKLLEFMLGALGNIIMDDELRRTLMLSTDVPRVLFQLLASPKWTRINFKIEFSVVELLIAFLSDGSENWKFEDCSRSYVCSKIQSIILNKWDVETDQIVKDFHYNSLESNVSLLGADHTPVCQLWSAWTLANFTEQRPELYVKKLKKENGVEALESLISLIGGKEIKKYAQMALASIASYE